MPKQLTREEADAEKARADLKRLNELNDLKNLMVDPRMRAFLWRFMAQTKLFGEPMHANFGIVGHNLGWRAAGMWLWNEITDADFEALLEMQRTHYLTKLDEANALIAGSSADSET